MAYVSRDPFARTELHREREYIAHALHGCTECGGYKETKRGRKYLFKYRTENDGGRSSEHRGLFCSRSCHNAYHS